MTSLTGLTTGEMMILSLSFGFASVTRLKSGELEVSITGLIRGVVGVADGATGAAVLVETAGASFPKITSGVDFSITTSGSPPVLQLLAELPPPGVHVPGLSRLRISSKSHIEEKLEITVSL